MDHLNIFKLEKTPWNQKSRERFQVSIDLKNKERYNREDGYIENKVKEKIGLQG